jgi:hypothetical protein
MLSRCPRLWIPLQVCSSWYCIAAASPRLWSPIPLIAYFIEPFEYDRGTNHLRLSFSCKTIPSTPLPRCGIPESYFPDDCFSTPDLTSLEIHAPADESVTQSDYECLRSFIQSSHSLRRFVFDYPFDHGFGPIQTSWSTLRELRLNEAINFPLCSYILRNAPFLSKASFHCTRYSRADDDIRRALPADIPLVDLTIPCSHPNLKTLIMVYNDSSIIAKLFRTFTLLHLQNLLLSTPTTPDGELTTDGPIPTFSTFSPAPNVC